ncbi:hypothetical protein [Polyangium mundeleinium]|uniref:MalT-like TPR region domain-containing protein n=1 Tax=Polyangium mundeleinium TaxID=2995306 RepID=A0ABT5ET63_9BACT|nr:hypothetical protein [Polyangium mundeleinium]MDC0744102.1 hypothetical protein [Polyangium mundeleinium]
MPEVPRAPLTRPGPLARLTEESEHGLDVLRRGLRRASSFALFVVLASDAARAEVLWRLQEWSGQEGLPPLTFFPWGAEAAEAVDAFLLASDRTKPLAGAVVPYAEVLLDEKGGEALRSLNMARDVLGRLIAGPLVLVLPEARAGEFARGADDLWDVRAGTTAVEAEAVAVAAAEADAVAVAELGTGAVAEAEVLRLREIEASGEVAPGALADAWLNVATAFLRAHAFEEAMSATETAEQHARGVGYTTGVIQALGIRAAVFQSIGLPEQSVRVSREALALSTAAGLWWITAASRLRLGKALHAMGALEEALVHLRGALKDFEALGMQQGQALALDEIADTHRARGQLDEALRIRRDEELPHYARTGDVRGLVVGRAEFALTLLARNAPGDREEAARFLLLAHADAERFQLPEAEHIRKVQQEHGLPTEDPPPRP